MDTWQEARKLHQMLDASATKEPSTRREAIEAVLSSQNLAVIRRLPHILKPFSNQEKELILSWGYKMAKNAVEVSDKDFMLHLLVSCGIESSQILEILEGDPTFSRDVLDRIQNYIEGESNTTRFCEYMVQVAEELAVLPSIPKRDRARHIRITLATIPEQWQELACLFCDDDQNIHDLRQGVIARFLNECSDESALEYFVNQVVEMCMMIIDMAECQDVHHVASKIHWVFMCLGRIKDRRGQLKFVNFIQLKFPKLPLSVQYQITYITEPWKFFPAVEKEKKNQGETNAEIAKKLGVSKRQVAKLRREGKL